MIDDGTLLINLSRGSVVCERLEVADTARRRMRGLLGRSSLPAGEGLLLHPAPSIHTAFMRFPIDAVFLDGTLRVRRVVADMPPWKTASVRHAWAVLELAAGEASRIGIAVGDQLGLVEVSDEIAAVVTAIDRRNRPVAAETEETGDATARPAERLLRLGPASDSPAIVVAGTDRRFRSVAAALLVRRGSRVVLADRLADADTLAVRERARVVVLDAGRDPAAVGAIVRRLQALQPRVGVIVVADEADGRGPQPVLARWGSFDGLCAAIEAVHQEGHDVVHV